MLYETEYKDMLREFYRSEWPELKTKMNDVIHLVKTLLETLIQTRIARQIYDVTPTKEHDATRYKLWCQNRQLYHMLMREIYGLEYEDESSDEEDTYEVLDEYPEYAFLD